MFEMRLIKSGQALTPFNPKRTKPGQGQVRLRVLACGVCRTDLHLMDGDLPLAGRPTVLGHEIVGTVEAVGPGVEGLKIGDRVGVPWLARSCGRCRYCIAGQENLCSHPDFTGWTVDGGFAETAIAQAAACLPIPEAFTDAEAAPLLCAGLIGFRAWRKAIGAAESVSTLGLYGFGAAAHLLAQLAVAKGQRVFAFVRPDDDRAAQFARDMGCEWAGPSNGPPPSLLDAAIIFAADGELVPYALSAVRKGGAVVCAGIHMSDIPSFPYALLWGERHLLSVANLQHKDGLDYLPLAAEAGIKPQVTLYPLPEANRALQDVRSGLVRGAAVLVP